MWRMRLLQLFGATVCNVVHHNLVWAMRKGFCHFFVTKDTVGRNFIILLPFSTSSPRGSTSLCSVRRKKKKKKKKKFKIAIKIFYCIVPQKILLLLFSSSSSSSSSYYYYYYCLLSLLLILLIVIIIIIIIIRTFGNTNHSCSGRHFDFFPLYFSEKRRRVISCESAATTQTIHMKCQVFFSPNDNLEYCLLQFC